MNSRTHQHPSDQYPSDEYPSDQHASDTHLSVPDASASGRVALTHYAGRAGDHNDRAMTGSRELAAGLSTALGVPPHVVGRPEPALSVGWEVELDACTPSLRGMAARLQAVLAGGATPVSAIGRCAVALATLPVVAAHRPDAVVVWLDAHADLHTPASTASGYLGGLAFSGPLGLWDSGLGSGLPSDRAVLVGARDIDPPEQELLDAGAVALVPVGADMASQLSAVVAGRPVYVHLDCDVLDAGIVPTDYRVPDGMTLKDLHAVAAALARSEVVGIEVGELESAPDSRTPPAYVTRLLEALDPLLQAVLAGGGSTTRPGPRPSGAAWVSIAATTADDPALLELVAAQEAEVMARYQVTDAGPGLTSTTSCLLARLDDRPVGCVAVGDLGGGTGELKRMYVSPSARGHRIGRRLLEAAEQLAAELGYRVLRLETGTQQPEALRLYGTAGWTRISCYGYFRDDPTTICMEKALR